MDYEVVWHGSKQGPNRGYLCVAADIPRQPLGVIEDWSASLRVAVPPLTMRKRVEAALDGTWMTSRQLQDACCGSVYAIAVVLQWLKRSGRLEQERVSAELFDLDRRGRYRYRLKA